MRRGEFGPMMYIILAVMALLAIIFLIIGLSNKSFSIVDWMTGKLG